MVRPRAVPMITAVLALALLLAAAIAPAPAAAAVAPSRGVFARGRLPRVATATTPPASTSGPFSTDTEVMTNGTFPSLLRQFISSRTAAGTRTCRCAPLPVPPGGMCVGHVDGAICMARPCTPAWTCLYGPPHGPSPATTVCRVTSLREDWVCDRNDWGASKLCPCSLRRSRKTLIVPITRN